jgi:hypothetical protein
MIDAIYKNAFAEVYEILQNTDDTLLEKVPKKFILFLQKNMNKEYKTNINAYIPIDKQVLLAETEDILALIYRSYWATDEEKINFLNRDKQQLTQVENNKKNQYKNINEIFEKKKDLNNITLDNSLLIIKKESFIKKIFKKLINIFK